MISAISQVSPDNLILAPRRFQYKLLSTNVGTTGSLANVQTWNPTLAGLIHVWQDPLDECVYVVNGHNRVILAQRLNVETVLVSYLDAKSDQDARAQGALINIAEGHGTSLDAAQFFRDTGATEAELIAHGVPLQNKVVKDGWAIAQLAPHLFQKTLVGELPIDHAVAIGSVSDKATQSAIADLLQGRIVAQPVLQEIVRLAKSAPNVALTQNTLFGITEEDQNFAVLKASLLADLRKCILRQRRIFSAVTRPKAVALLTQVGNRLQYEANHEQLEKANMMLSRLDELKYVSPFSDLLNQAVLDVAQGGDRQAAINNLLNHL